MTKRDLADLCLEGLLESTEQQQQVQQAELLQAGLECDTLLCTYTCNLSCSQVNGSVAIFIFLLQVEQPAAARSLSNELQNHTHSFCALGSFMFAAASLCSTLYGCERF